MAVAVAGWLVAARPATAEPPAFLRVAHLSPDTPAVDVTVTRLPDGAPAASAPGLRYGGVSPYQPLAPGRYAVAIRAAGAGPATPAPLSVAVDLSAGTARTVALDDRFADLRLTVLTDDLSPPPPGTARVRAVAAAGSAPTVAVLLDGGPALARGLRFPQAGAWTTAPGGSSTARISDGERTVAVPVRLPPGAVVTLLVLDAPGGGVTVRPVIDAAGPAVVPSGPVDAGHGGAAGWSAPASVPTTVRTAQLLGGPPPSTRVAGAAAVATPSPPASVPSPPVRLLAPGAGIDAALVPIAPDAAGSLAAPDDPAGAGWLDSGPAPGTVGPAVIAGHVDDAAGPAVFFRLGRLRPGDPVVVVRADASRATFAVDRVAGYPKAAFPTAEVYGPTPDPQLRLITCGGRFDRAAGSYEDNVVVFAHLVT